MPNSQTPPGPQSISGVGCDASLEDRDASRSPLDVGTITTPPLLSTPSPHRPYRAASSRLQTQARWWRAHHVVPGPRGPTNLDTSCCCSNAITTHPSRISPRSPPRRPTAVRPPRAAPTHDNATTVPRPFTDIPRRPQLSQPQPGTQKLDGTRLSFLRRRRPNRPGAMVTTLHIDHSVTTSTSEVGVEPLRRCGPSACAATSISPRDDSRFVGPTSTRHPHKMPAVSSTSWRNGRMGHAGELARLVGTPLRSPDSRTLRVIQPKSPRTMVTNGKGEWETWRIERDVISFGGGMAVPSGPHSRRGLTVGSSNARRHFLTLRAIFDTVGFRHHIGARRSSTSWPRAPVYDEWVFYDERVPTEAAAIWRSICRPPFPCAGVLNVTTPSRVRQCSPRGGLRRSGGAGDLRRSTSR